METQGLPLCPACGNSLRVTRLRCTRCETEVHGVFDPVLTGLSLPQQAFAAHFLRTRGNLKELERELGMGYQTLRSQLDEIVAALGAVPSGSREDILGRMRRGDLRPEEALRLLEADVSRAEDSTEEGEGD